MDSSSALQRLIAEMRQRESDLFYSQYPRAEPNEAGRAAALKEVQTWREKLDALLVQPDEHLAAAYKQDSELLDQLEAEYGDIREGARQRAAREWQPTREGEAACLDCGLPYSAFPLDVNLPRAQWLDIHPDDGGLLCAACIVQRVKDRIPGVTVLHMVAEVTPAHQHDRSCRLNSWLNDGPCTCGNQLTPAPPGLAREGLDTSAVAETPSLPRRTEAPK